MAIRNLRDDEPTPEGVPRRYVQTPTGYITLRWRVGPNEYVERREHRQVALDQGWDIVGKHVHHMNHDGSDNRVENLMVVSVTEHGRQHRSINHSEVVGLYQQGVSMREIARSLGVNGATIFRIVQAAGVVRKEKPPNYIHVDEDEVKRRYLRGESPRSIAVALGVGDQVVRNRVKSMGLPSRRSGRYVGWMGELGGRSVEDEEE